MHLVGIYITLKRKKAYLIDPIEKERYRVRNGTGREEM